MTGTILVIALCCLTASFGTATAQTYNTFPVGLAKPAWPADNQWRTLPGLETSPTNSSLSGSLGRLDFVGDAAHPTAFYASDAGYVYFRVRINAANPSYPNDSSWTHTIMVLVDKNDDHIPDYAFSWDTKGSGTDHQLELNVPPNSGPNTSATPWSSVHMDDRDGNSGAKLHPDFNTLSGHTNDGFVRLVANQPGPGVGNTAFVDFAVYWSYLTGTDTVNSSAITSLTPGQSWRVQVASINNGTDHSYVNADVAGSATLSTTLGSTDAWSDPIAPDDRTYTWTGAAFPDANWGTGSNWDAGLAPVDGADLVFPAVSGEKVNPVNNLTGLTIHSVTITGTGYTISGNPVTISAGFTNSSGALSAFNCPMTLSANQAFELGGNTTFSGSIANDYALTVSTASAKESAFTGVISGNGSITKTGAGTHKLATAVNTYTGKTLVLGGTLWIDRESSLGEDPGLFTPDQLKLDGGTLQVNNNVIIGDNNPSLGITLGAGGATFITDPGVTFDVMNVVTGPGALSKSGAGKMRLVTVANTYAGKTTVGAGTLVINGEDRLGASPASPTADQLTINGGTLNAIATFSIQNANRGVTLGSANAIIAVNSGYALTVAKAITGPGSLTKTLAGTLTLSAANTYAGGTVLSAGTLNINSNSALGSGRFTIGGVSTIDNTSAGAVTVAGNAQSWNANFTFAGTQELNLGSGPVALGTTCTVAVSARKLSVGGIISGTAGLTKAGAGTLFLSGANTYSGATVVSGGKLLGVTGSSCASSAITVGATTATNGVSITDNAKQWSCASLSYSAAGTLNFNFGSIVPSTTLAPLQVNGNVAFTATPVVLVEAESIPEGGGIYPLMTWTGTQSGTAPTAVILPPQVNGKLSVSGNTLNLIISINEPPLRWFTAGGGTWMVGGGTKYWKDSAAPPVSAFYTETAGLGDAVQFEDTMSSGSGPFSIALNTTVRPVSVIVNNPTKDYSIFGGGSISGSTALIKSGAGKLTLSVANTFTGGTTLSNGTLVIDHPSALGSGTFDIEGGTIDTAAGTTLSGNAQTWNGDFTFAGSANLSLGNGAVALNATRQVTVSANTLTVGGVISGPGCGLTKLGLGTLTLSGASTYDGPTAVSAGKLVVSGSTASGSAVAVATGATLAGTGNAAGTIALSGTIAPGESGVGTLNTGPETWVGGATNVVEINDAIGTQGWDALNINGALTVDATSGSRFTIKVVSLSGSSPGQAAHFDSSQSYAWRIASASGGVSGFAEDKFTLDVSGFQNDKGAVGAFSLSQTGNDLYLNFTPVFAFPAAYGRAWGTFQRLPISGLLATCTTGNVERAFVSVATGSQGTTPTVSGGLILIAPTHNLPETFPYVVQLAGYPSSLATNTITLLVTNAVSRVNGVVANGSSAMISFAGVPGYQYLVQRASSVSGPWTDLDGSGGTPDSRQTAPSNGTWTFTDSSPPNPSFYRGRQNND